MVSLAWVFSRRGLPLRGFFPSRKTRVFFPGVFPSEKLAVFAAFFVSLFLSIPFFILLFFLFPPLLRNMPTPRFQTIDRSATLVKKLVRTTCS